MQQNPVCVGFPAQPQELSNLHSHGIHAGGSESQCLPQLFQVAKQSWALESEPASEPQICQGDSQLAGAPVSLQRHPKGLCSFLGPHMQASAHHCGLVTPSSLSVQNPNPTPKAMFSRCECSSPGHCLTFQPLRSGLGHGVSGGQKYW